MSATLAFKPAFVCASLELSILDTSFTAFVASILRNKKKIMHALDAIKHVKAQGQCTRM